MLSITHVKCCKLQLPNWNAVKTRSNFQLKHCTINGFTIFWNNFNTFAPGVIQAVHTKTAGLHVALRENIFGPVSVTDPVKRHSKSCSLHSKNFFGWGVLIFYEWHHKWRTFRRPWPTSPGPGPKPLDGSISLKFLLETRLQSESFDTLDDLLGFWVQKLWSKVIKIFD